MATAVADLTSLLKGLPSGAWVAISERENAVVAFGIDPQTVVREANEAGEDHPLITRVPDRTATMFF